jgi:hypothetical protein
LSLQKYGLCFLFEIIILIELPSPIKGQPINWGEGVVIFHKIKRQLIFSVALLKNIFMSYSSTAAAAAARNLKASSNKSAFESTYKLADNQSQNYFTQLENIA